MRKIANIERCLARSERVILNRSLSFVASLVAASPTFAKRPFDWAWPELRRFLEAVDHHKILELERLDATLPKAKLPKIPPGHKRAYVQCNTAGCGWVGYYDYPPSGLVLVDIMKPCRHIRAHRGDFSLKPYVRDVPKREWMWLYRARLARKPLPVGCAGYRGG